MEPKYSIHTSLSKEEYIRFNRYLIHQNKRSMTILILSTLLVLAFAIDHFIRGVNLPIAVGRWTKDDRRSTKDDISFIRKKLFLVFRTSYIVIRTKNDLYLMRSPQVGTILPLTSCPEGLVDYIMQIKQQHSL